LSYNSPPPAWMPGKEALHHIREADKCSASNAVKQLQSALTDGIAKVRLPDPNDHRRLAIFPPWGDDYDFGPGATPMLSPGSRQIPTPEDWRNAKILASGVVRFFGGRSRPYAFKVHRADDLRIWPESALTLLPITQRKRTAPIAEGIREAIDSVGGRAVLARLKGKDRCKRILAWLKSNNRSVPSGNGLPKAVQRAMKPLA
jgi:hypothetical protein